MRGHREPGSFELQALSSSASPAGHQWPDVASAFRQEEQEAARRQGGDCVWNQPFPGRPGPCHAHLAGEPDLVRGPSAGRRGAGPRRTGRWPGCSLTLPGAPLRGRSPRSGVAQTLTRTAGLPAPPHLVTSIPAPPEGRHPGASVEQREGERSGPRRPPPSASVCHLSQFAAQVGRPFSPSSPPLLLPALGSLSGSGRWGPSPGPGAAGLRVEAVAGPPRAWPWPLRPPSSALLHLSGGRKRGGTADKRPGTQQTLTALETLPNQHAFSPPFENKNGARMDRWEAGSRSQLRRAGGRFPEGTGVRGRAWGHLTGQGPRMGRCDQQAGGQAVSACAHQPHGGYRKGGGGGLTRPCLCGCEDRGHPHTGVRSPGVSWGPSQGP